MAAVRFANTGRELGVRRQLHALGLRFRLHQTSLPGSPDIALKKHRAVISCTVDFAAQWRRVAAESVSSQTERKLRCDTALVENRWPSFQLKIVSYWPNADRKSTRCQ